MIKKIIFTIVVFSLSGCSQYFQSHSLLKPSKIDNALVGGIEIGICDEAASLAIAIRGKKIENNDLVTETCTGSFINDNVIITAAHCFRDSEMKYEVIADPELPILDKEDANTHIIQIEKIIVHDSFKNKLPNSDGIYDDIALVKIKGKRPSHINVLERPSDFFYMDSIKIRALGYGKTTGVKSAKDLLLSKNRSGILREATLTSLNYDPFMSYFNIDQTNHHGLCFGDSGGPGIIKKDGKYYILGVANSVMRLDKYGNKMNKDPESNKPGYDSCGYHSRYMNVQYYLEWITSHLDN